MVEIQVCKTRGLVVLTIRPEVGTITDYDEALSAAIRELRIEQARRARAS